MASVLRAASRTLPNSKAIFRNKTSLLTLKGNISTTSKLLVAGINDDLFDLTDEQKEFRQTVHDFCTKELGPYADQIDKDNGWSDLR